MNRAKILDEAKKIVTRDRNKQYGEIEDNFGLISQYWSIYLENNITSHDVAIMMALLKIARIKTGEVKEDSYVDIAGYSACAGEIALSNNEIVSGDE